MNNLRKILFPFALLYYCITRLRNYFYNKGWFDSKTYDFPIIGIGNLSVGGTGKSPMTEYIIRLLKNNSTLATLSRGYGRKTTGFLNVDKNDSAERVGDEPLQFARKFPHVKVAVDENRRRGIELLADNNPKPEVILLDDVFQHRKVKPGLMILLTAYEDLFYKDYLLPSGNLREPRKGANRADCVVVTKCAKNITKKEQSDIREKINKYTSAPVYFSFIDYSRQVFGSQEILLEDLKSKKLTVVTGIANPKPFLSYLNENDLAYNHLQFKDHHNFTQDEINRLNDCSYILTTEKDYVRLRKEITKAQIFYLPIQFTFIENGETFDNAILEFVKGF